MKTEDLVMGKLYYIERSDPYLFFFSKINGYTRIRSFLKENNETTFVYIGYSKSDFEGMRYFISVKTGTYYYFSLDKVINQKLEECLYPLKAA